MVEYARSQPAATASEPAAPIDRHPAAQGSGGHDHHPDGKTIPNRTSNHLITDNARGVEQRSSTGNESPLGRGNGFGNPLDVPVPNSAQHGQAAAKSQDPNDDPEKTKRRGEVGTIAHHRAALAVGLEMVSVTPMSEKTGHLLVTPACHTKYPG